MNTHTTKLYNKNYEMVREKMALLHNAWKSMRLILIN